LRIALGIEYEGTDFHGWQRLSHGACVQGDIEKALSFVAAEPIEVIAAGRTDAGVHAHCQVVHFDTQANRSERAWILGCNSRLPNSVALRWAQPVSDDFHARYRAYARRYRYIILNRPIRPALDARFVTWERMPLNIESMQIAAQALIGEHDFSAFRTLACQAKSPVRTIREINIARENERIIIEIEANAFLHHMVRNIVGSLLPIGRGLKNTDWIATLLAGRNRALASPTAPANGLTFLNPLYSVSYGLPDEVSGELATT